jgi:hypothetical protein
VFWGRKFVIRIRLPLYSTVNLPNVLIFDVGARREIQGDCEFTSDKREVSM